MGSFWCRYLDTTQHLCLARDCVLSVRGSGTTSASCLLASVSGTGRADDRDGDADEERRGVDVDGGRGRFFLPSQLLIWMSNDADENSQMDFFVPTGNTSTVLLPGFARRIAFNLLE